MFIISVNVLFLSNSQLLFTPILVCRGVYHKCQCPLFKQFTTGKKATASVVYNIYCPKGTKGIYTEPYSCYGEMGSSGHTWDGVTKLDVCKEVEVILQRGTKFRVTKAEYKGGKWFIDMEVIEQPVKMPNIP